MNRQCNRAGCGEAAAASLGFDYAQRTAWLIDSVRPHPATYGLCQRHADGLRVPVGWTLRDERSGRPTVLDGAPAR
jgi:hypothetical protein